MTARTTRRGLLALAPAAALAPASAAAHPAADARLIRLCAVYIAEEAECDAIWSPFFDVLGGRPDPIAEARSIELVDRSHRLRDLIARIPARTRAGMEAKARAVVTDLCEPSDLDDHPTRLARSLAGDVLAWGGRA